MYAALQVQLVLLAVPSFLLAGPVHWNPLLGIIYED